jgi:hypothetical protein
LTPHREAFAVTDTPIATDVHQTFDIHTHGGTQSAFGLKPAVNDLSNLVKFIFGEVFDLFMGINTRFGEDSKGRRFADAKDIRQRYFAVLIVRYFDACNSSHL